MHACMRVCVVVCMNVHLFAGNVPNQVLDNPSMRVEQKNPAGPFEAITHSVDEHRKKWLHNGPPLCSAS